MNSLARLIAGCILLSFFYSCSRAGTENHDPLPDRGTVHRHIVVHADSNRSYALYIPKRQPFPAAGKGEPARFPVIIAFDPHGDGSLPLVRYKELAERYGILLAGSNDSRNGLPGDQATAIVDGLTREIRTQYPVDTSRIWFLGFSGGARVASGSAMYLTPVRGVIGCGSGFGNTRQPLRYRFDYIGLAGLADFNMHEVQKLEEPLTRAGFRHFISVFPGGHEWPPAGVMENAFRMTLLNDMKDGRLAKNDSLPDAVLSSLKVRIDSLARSGDPMAAAEYCRWAIALTEGLAPTGPFRESLSGLSASSLFRERQTYREEVLLREEKEKEMLIRDIREKSVEWWKERTGREFGLRKNVRIAAGWKRVEDTLMSHRLLSFLSLYCYMNAQSALARRENEAAIKIVTVYGLCDPSNPEPDYMNAVLHARRGENKEAMSSLRSALGKGFSDKPRMLSQPEFSGYTGTPGWTEMLSLFR